MVINFINTGGGGGGNPEAEAQLSARTAELTGVIDRTISGLTIPSGVTEIGEHAFDSCSALTEVVIPASVTSIQANAFGDNTSLTTITFEGDTPPTIEDGAFSNLPREVEIVVPEGHEDDYVDVTERVEESIIPWVIATDPNGDEYTFSYEDGYIPNNKFLNWGSCKVEMSDNITVIGNRAFANMQALSSLTLSSGITTIGEYAFQSDGGVTGTLSLSNIVTMSDGAFQNMSGITAVEFGENLEEIGSWAFIGCSSLSSITVNCGVAPKIGVSAFDNVASSGVIHINTDAENYDEYGWGYLVGYKLPSGWSVVDQNGDALSLPAIKAIVTLIDGTREYIPSSNDVYATQLGQIELSGYSKTAIDVEIVSPAVSGVGQYAMTKFTYLTGVTIPSTVSRLEMYAFSECPSLVSVNIPMSGLTYFGTQCFSKCYSLSSITIPSTVRELSSSSFAECSGITATYTSNLENWCTIKFGNNDANPLKFSRTLYIDGETIIDLEIPNTVSAISDYTFYNLDFTNIDSLIFNEGLKTIGKEAFYGCSGLTEVSLPESLTTLSDGAFRLCKDIESISLGTSGVTYIGADCFRDDNKFTSISLPSTLTTIKQAAFMNCTSLSEITCWATTAPTLINTTTFQNVAQGGVLYYPQGSNYSAWMSSSKYFLGYSNWTSQEIS